MIQVRVDSKGLDFRLETGEIPQIVHGDDRRLRQVLINLVSLMAGQLQVESRPGQGSRFWFDIPLPVVDDSPLGAVFTADSRPYRLSGGTVDLLADVDLTGYRRRLLALYDLAPAGDVGELRRAAADLGQEESLRPLAEKLLQLSDTFQINEICQLLEEKLS